jgi:hypothetical protein
MVGWELVYGGCGDCICKRSIGGSLLLLLLQLAEDSICSGDSHHGGLVDELT